MPYGIDKSINKKLYLRIGKTITTLDFNNVIKPASLANGDPNIPAVTSLIYTPIFINPLPLMG